MRNTTKKESACIVNSRLSERATRRYLVPDNEIALVPLSVLISLAVAVVSSSDVVVGVVLPFTLLFASSSVGKVHKD